MSTKLGEKVVLEAEVANEQMTVKWQKNGQEITPGKNYQIVTKGNLTDKQWWSLTRGCHYSHV